MDIKIHNNMLYSLIPSHKFQHGGDRKLQQSACPLSFSTHAGSQSFTELVMAPLISQCFDARPLLDSGLETSFICHHVIHHPSGLIEGMDETQLHVSSSSSQNSAISNSASISSSLWPDRKLSELCSMKQTALEDEKGINIPHDCITDQDVAGIKRRSCLEAFSFPSELNLTTWRKIMTLDHGNSEALHSIDETEESINRMPYPSMFFNEENKAFKGEACYGNGEEALSGVTSVKGKVMGARSEWRVSPQFSVKQTSSPQQQLDFCILHEEASGKAMKQSCRIAISGAEAAHPTSSGVPSLTSKQNGTRKRLPPTVTNIQPFIAPQPKRAHIESNELGDTSMRTVTSIATRSNTSCRKAMGRALNTNGKPRAPQGSANDPQSLAARNRRERINARLKILQELVPNGSKVDLVTMLEKAINYVKHLQLQLRVLSNDDLWQANQDNPSDIAVTQNDEESEEAYSPQNNMAGNNLSEDHSTSAQ
ncbi:hypothetical protein KP509_08G040100 [Ceratopteris richardii]|uniref:BHLH domain-containing protein n=1 Tax=Ceratopteris richardii TaxID=49495 RepID=A0A8T2U9S4_CERRI|nr:hypothetical protein KP509_08G040100 [Ceratopteris richardii]